MDNKETISGLCRANFQRVIDGKETDLFILKNKNGYEVAVTNYGGAIVAIMVPDRDGKLANVIQGYDSIEAYQQASEPFLSTLVGRYAGRIAGGKFHLNGKEYNVATNCGGNHLHGGPTGFHARVWDAEQVGDQTLVLRYVSAYYEEGFPGELTMAVRYSWTDDNELYIDYRGTTNKKTLVNMTHHGFFCLQGVGAPTTSAMEQQVMINADYFLPIGDKMIPTGEIRSVEGTCMDFRAAHAVSDKLGCDCEQIKLAGGYDHCFVLRKQQEGEFALAARVCEPTTGRIMEVLTTEPGLQFYTANFSKMDKFPARSALCFEAQHFPDSPNHPYFPSVVLQPGEVYKQKTVYRFDAE